jgi:hypothetical protein
MRKDLKSDIKSTSNYMLLAFAMMFGLSACGDAEWEKQGYESEEIFEQALEGGFQSPGDFAAAQQYQITTKSEWDALVESLRCVETEAKGEVCVNTLLGWPEWEAYDGYSGDQYLSRLRREIYERRDGTALEFSDVALAYEISSAQRMIDNANVELAIKCVGPSEDFRTVYDRSWVMFIKSSSPLVSQKHWTILRLRTHYIEDGGEIVNGSSVIYGVDVNGPRHESALLLRYHPEMRAGKLTKEWHIYGPNVEVTPEQYSLTYEPNLLEVTNEYRIDRKKGVATRYDDGRQRTGGERDILECENFEGDAKQVVASRLLKSLESVMLGEIALYEKVKSERVEKERAEKERAEMDAKF